MRFTLFFLFLSFLNAPVAAQIAENTRGLMRYEGTLLNISASENVEVEQDLLVANLRIEDRMEDARALQTKINRMMAAALEKAQEFDDVETQTTRYYVYRDYFQPKDDDEEGRRERWRGSQELVLESENAEQLLELAGLLQDAGFLMGGLDYQLSAEKEEATRESLLETVLEKLQARAARVGTALGKQNRELVEVNIDAAPSFKPQPVMMRGMATMDMAAESAPPVAEAGTQEVSMSVSAKVLLK